MDNNIKIIIDVVSPNAARAAGDVKKVIGDIGAEAEKVTKKRVSDEQTAAKEVERINQQTAKNTQKFLSDQEKLDDKLTNQRIANANKAARASADAFLNSLKEVETKQSSSSSVFGGSLAGSFLGGVASQGVTMLLQDLEQIPSYAISAGKELFNLAKNASDYGREISSAENKTGLTAESLSVLRYDLQLSGRSFSDASKPLSSFALLLGEIKKNNPEAILKGNALHITDVNNFDQSLKQALNTINQLPGGLDKINAASDAFGGRRNADVAIAMAKNFGLASAEAEKLGLVLSQPQINAARDFGVAYDRISAQVEGLSAQFALEFAPAITDVANDLSHFASDNQGAIKQWGITTGNIIRGAVTSYKELSDFIDQHPYLVAALGFGAVSAASEARKQPQSLGGKAFDTAAKFLIPAYGLASGLSDIGELAPHGIGASAGASNIEKDYTAQFEKQTEELQKSFQVQQAIQAAGFKVSEARLNDHLNYTIQDQIESAQAETKLKNSEISQKLASETDYYNKQIVLNKGNSEKIKEFQGEITKAEKTAGLERQTNEINLQHQILQLRKQQRDQERQDALSFYSLQTQSNQQFYDKQVFDLQRKITLSAGLESGSFASLISLTNQNYQKVLQLTDQTFDEQLKKEGLTDQQIINLKLQKSLAEQKLEQDNKQKIIQILDERRQRELAIISKTYEQKNTIQGEQLNNTAEFVKSLLSGGLSPDTFNSQINKTLNALKELQQFNKDYSDKQVAISDINNGTYNGGDLQGLLKDKNDLLNMSGRTAEQESQLTKFTNEYNDAIQKRNELEFKLNGIMIDRNHFLNENPDIWGLAQTAPLLNLLKTADFSKLETFTQIQKGQTNLSYTKQYSELETKRDELTKNLENEKGGTTAAKNWIDQLDAVNSKIRGVQLAWDNAIQDINSNSPEGLKKYIEDLAGNAYEKGNIIYGANQAMWQDAKKLAQENIALESEYYKNGEVLAIERRNTILLANKSIYESEVKLSQAMQISNIEINASIKEHLASQQNLSQAIASGFNSTFDAIITKANSGLDKLNDKTHGLLSFITEPLKAIQDNKISNIFGGIVDKIFPPEIASQFKKTGNPIVDKISESNSYLKRLADEVDSRLGIPHSAASHSILGSAAAVIGGSSNGGVPSFLANAIASLDGGGGSSGFNGYTTGSDDIIPTLAAIGLGANNGRGTLDGGILQPNAANNTSLLQGLKNIFSTNQGGLFAPIQSPNGQGSSAIGGYLNGAGGIAALLGGLIGGTTGKYLSNIGGGITQGISIGSLFGPAGTAIGAAVGAGVGLIESIFGGSTRRQDEQARDALMTTSLNSLNQIKQQLTDYRDGKIQSLNISDLDSQAHAIQTAYFTQANTLHDSKTKNIAVKDGNERVSPLVSIIDALAQGDTLLQSIKESANDRSQRLLAEFAGGGYVRGYDGGTAMQIYAAAMGYSSFLPKNYSGLIPGVYDRADDKLLAVSGGEHAIIMNPRQWSEVGNDIAPMLKRARVPGFADGVYLPPTFAPSVPAAVSVPAANNVQTAAADQPINVYIYPEFKFDADGMVTTTLKNSYSAGKAVKAIVNDGFYNGEIRTKRR